MNLLADPASAELASTVVHLEPTGRTKCPINVGQAVYRPLSSSILIRYNLRPRLGPILGPGAGMRHTGKLSARKVATLSKPGRHGDGAGLYLSISKAGDTLRRRWVYLFTRGGKLREMGLGGFS